MKFYYLGANLVWKKEWEEENGALGSFLCSRGDIPAVQQLIADTWQHWRTLNFLLCLPCCFDKASSVLQMLRWCGIILPISNKRYLFLNVFTGSLQVTLVLRVLLVDRGRVLRMTNVPVQQCQGFFLQPFFSFIFFLAAHSEGKCDPAKWYFF